MKRIALILAFFATTLQLPLAHSQAADSVVIKVGKASKVLVAIGDKADLETMKKYNFQQLFDDIITKLEAQDSTGLRKPSAEYLKTTPAEVVIESDNDDGENDIDNFEDRDDDDDDWYESRRTRRRSGTSSTFAVDLGMNNFLEGGKFPDNQQYTVKPWGSWYVGGNAVLKTHVGGKFFLEWGGGVSWYNFKFQDSRTLLTKGPDDVVFSQDARDLNFEKSKLTATYLGLHLVPLLDFGRNYHKPHPFEMRGRSFRIGAGPYVGYRIDSYTKQMYKQDGDKEKDHNHDNFYLTNMRYGVRAQVGFRSTDLFFQYDLNGLFNEGRGPELNALSFGITF
jgi:hypothetical protein